MGVSKKPPSVVTFTIIRSTDPSPASEVQHAKDNIDQMNDVHFKRLLEKVDTFVNLVAGISEVQNLETANYLILNALFSGQPICQGCMEHSCYCLKGELFLDFLKSVMNPFEGCAESDKPG